MAGNADSRTRIGLTLAPTHALIVAFGGVMSGKSKPKAPRAPVDGRKAKTGPTGTDDCNLIFEVDLTSLRPAVGQLVRGGVLDVDLVGEGNLEAAVCRRPVERDVVGSLAAFERLAKLMDCLRRGNRYAADVISVSRAGCRVRVRRV